MQIYDSDNSLILDVVVDDTSYGYKSIMGEYSLTLYFSLAEHVDLPLGSWCMYKGLKYTLYSPQNIKLIHSRQYEYTVIFESESYKARIYKFRNPVDGRLKFSLTAKPHEHLQMFVDNMNMRDSGWIVGADCISDTEKLINYDHDFCMDALARMSEEFDTEYEIIDKVVTLRKVEYYKNDPLPLAYGRGNGFLTGLKRDNGSDSPPVETLYVQGGERNIDKSKYGNSMLLLPRNQILGFDGEHFEDEEGYNADIARHYRVDNEGYSITNIDREPQSLTEDSLDRSEDYPKRIGTVSSVIEVNAEKNLYDIVDDTIPETLDYEECLIAGENMTIIFQSGMLAGREFDVAYYHNPKHFGSVDKEGRRFEIVPQEIDGITMPGDDNYIPVVGDTYAIFGCMLPDSYINAYKPSEGCFKKEGAEWDMFREAVKYMYENEDRKFTFTGELDGIWAKRNWDNINAKICLGGYISFRDANIQKESVLVRITGIKDWINKPHSPTIELSNEVISPRFSSSIKTLEAQDVAIGEAKKQSIQFTKRRFRDAEETMLALKDVVEGYTDSISPISIHTMSLLAGDESLQFQFVASFDDLTVVHDYAYYDNNTKKLTIQDSYIQHLTLGVNDITTKQGRAKNTYRIWSLPAFDSGYLNPEEIGTRYLYAIVSQTEDTGQFLLSPKPLQFVTTDIVGNISLGDKYCLLVGVLNSEVDGSRSFATLYGYTEILPGRITTERLVSQDGESWLDLSGGAMQLGDCLQYNIDGDKTLRLKFLCSEEANLGGWVFRNGQLESQAQDANGNPVAWLNGVKGEMRLSGTIQHSTSTNANFSDVDIFSLPAVPSVVSTPISMGEDKEDIGKRCLLTNTSAYGSKGTYKISTRKFGWDSRGIKYTLDAEYFNIFPGETVEMTCFEIDSLQFASRTVAVEGGWWRITNRYNQEIPRVVAMGRVLNSSNGATISGWTVGGKKLSVNRNGTSKWDGTYTITLPDLFDNCNDMLVIATGRGVAQNDDTPIKATVISQTGRTIVVRTSDDASDNAGSFDFICYDYSGWSF